MTNLALFQEMNLHAITLYTDAVNRALAHQCAGRTHKAQRAFEDAEAYNRYCESARRNLQKVRQ